MSVLKRKPIQANAENEEEVQQDEDDSQHSRNRTLTVLQRLPKRIYELLWPGVQLTGRVFRFPMRWAMPFLVFVILSLGTIYIIWNYVVKKLIFLFICGSIIGYVPGISYYCTQYSTLNNDNSTMVPLPINSVVEKTVELAERLSDADVNAPIKLSEIKISLIDLKTSVLHSHLDQDTRDQLLAQIDVILSSVGSTRNEIHQMLAVFNGVLKHLEIYTYNLDRLLTDGTEVTNSQSKFPAQLKQYLEDIERETERTMKIANQVYSMLVNLEENNNVLVTISSKSYEINNLKLIEIQNASSIVKLYRTTIGDGNINEAKYKRNVQVLDGFSAFIKSAAIHVENIINKLKGFEAEVAEVKYSLSNMNHPKTLSVDIHKEILKHCMGRLHEYQQRLNGRINERNKKED